ncbi:DUF1254 domain-containing protein [Legionella lytica]|uniref:DUF1254 domain-containing protein n=1 Tax=Legionella lytica TaxID=96232 RepID=A0ABW8D359_9GAMM
MLSKLFWLLMILSTQALCQNVVTLTPAQIQSAQDEQTVQQAVVAYRFWYPTVSAEAIFHGYREKNILDNKSLVILAATPQQLGFTLNSDTPYGGGTLDLTQGPFVIELPPGPYIALVDDHHQRWIVDMGIPGPDRGKGGKYLIVPPNYDKPIPEGYHVAHSSTYKLMLAIRALPQGGDTAGALNSLRKIKVYPLASASNPQLVTYVDGDTFYMDTTPLRWEKNIEYWKQLAKVINEEPILDEYKPMYGLLASLGIEKGQPFNPDERMQAILTKAAEIGHSQMMLSSFTNQSENVLVWPDRKWQWIGTLENKGNFETPWGIDLAARDRWFAIAIAASPAMFSRAPGAGSLYWLGIRDKKNQYLDGSKSYQLTIPQPVPARLFWSVTVYDVETRSEIQTEQNKAVLGSLMDFKDVDKSKPVPLYFGPIPPADKNARWIKTIPGKNWFSLLRIYGPEALAFDGSWKPGDFEQISQ